jgi:GR25 family glycosyltransferase involved in LPS biosynthesis
MRLFDYFDKVYCVNLDRREDRFENFKKEVEKYNLGEFERFSAYDGKTIDMSKYNTRLNPGELGLVLSNLEIIKNAKTNKLKNVLIIEDDCKFTDEVLNIKDYFDLLPKNWDMLYMGGNHNIHMGINPPDNINEKVIKLHSTYSTHFVGINSTAFDHIEVILSKFSEPLDVSYIRLQRIFNVYSYYPAIAKQIVDFSDIQNSITDYNWLIK